MVKIPFQYQPKGKVGNPKTPTKNNAPMKKPAGKRGC